MGLGPGLANRGTCFKHKFRWLFRIPDLSEQGTFALPPLRSARPNLAFKEIEVQHVSETVFLPGKPEWKPLSLTLYDVKSSVNPVFSYLSRLYDPAKGTYRTPVTYRYFSTATLTMYNGCGDAIEDWVLENVYPQAIDWGELDMSNGEFATVDIMLRYARAYIVR